MATKPPTSIWFVKFAGISVQNQGFLDLFIEHIEHCPVIKHFLRFFCAFSRHIIYQFQIFPLACLTTVKGQHQHDDLAGGWLIAIVEPWIYRTWYIYRWGRTACFLKHVGEVPICIYLHISRQIIIIIIIIIIIMFFAIDSTISNILIHILVGLARPYKVVPQVVSVQLVYKYYFTRVDE